MNILWLTEIRNLYQMAHEMTITILAVAGIRTDNRPHEIPTSQHIVPLGHALKSAL